MGAACGVVCVVVLCCGWVTLQVFLALIDCLRFGCVGGLLLYCFAWFVVWGYWAGWFGWFCLCLVLACRYLCFGLMVGIYFLG